MKAAGRTVEVTHRVAATPEVVFPYFTEPDKYRRWKGLEADLDARPGGVYRVKMWDGGTIEGSFIEVDRPNRIVFSWGWTGPALPPGMADVPPGTSVVEVTLEPDGDGTIIRLQHSGLPSEDAGTVHTWGWTTYLPRLEIVAAGGDPGPEPAPARAREYLGRGWITPGPA